MKLSKNCAVCGTTFYKSSTVSLPAWNTKTKHCSRRCSALSVRDVTIARNKQGTGKKLSDGHKQKLKDGRLGKKPNLGNKHSLEVRIKIKEAVLLAQTPEVRLKKSLAHRGEKSHNWKGGRMSLKHLMRTNALYPKWRTGVFTRDSFTCVWCGDARGGNLEADHIMEVNVIFDTFKIKTIDEVIACEILWDVSNGRTLCKNCHIKRHQRVL